MAEGTSSTTFSPVATMTRGQFVAILSRREGNVDFVSLYPPCGYTDVSASQYYYEHINWLKIFGISDSSGSEFRPDEPILRDELVIMLGKYLEYKGVTLPDDPSAPDSFKDADKISVAAKPYADILRRCGMLVGDNGYLKPQSNMTRAEGVTVFMRIGQKLIAGEPTEPETPDWENYNPTYNIPTGKSAVDADGGYYDYELANEIMTQINTLRRDNGLDALLYNPKIQAWAGIRAEEQLIIEGHTRPGGSDCLTVGQGLTSENITILRNCSESELSDVYALAKRTVSNWYSSQGHQNNMLRAQTNLGAVSCYVKGSSVHIVHLFSSRTLYYMDFMI